MKRLFSLSSYHMKRLFSLSSYQRITSTNNYVPEIDGLRFIAIITVLFLHLNTNFKRVFSDFVPTEYNDSVVDVTFLTSGLGVEIFFAISGYILILPFLRYWKYGGSRISMSKYFKRRLSRLEPPFIISLLIIYAANLLISAFSFQESFPHFLATLFYSHMFVYGTWSNINPVTWSLETEVQFYIIAPLLAIIFSIRKAWFYRLVFLGLLVLSISSMGLSFIKDLHLTKSIIPSLQWFLVGIIYADIQLRFPDWARKPSVFADLFAWLAVPLLFFSKIYAGHFLYDLNLLLFFISAFKSISFKRFICNKFVTTVGGMCYTIYLLHYALIYITMNLISGLNLNNFYLQMVVVFLLCLTIILAVSFLFFRLCERPFMRKNWTKNWKSVWKTAPSSDERTVVSLRTK